MEVNARYASLDPTAAGYLRMAFGAHLGDVTPLQEHFLERSFLCGKVVAAAKDMHHAQV